MDTSIIEHQTQNPKFVVLDYTLPSSSQPNPNNSSLATMNLDNPEGTSGDGSPTEDRGEKVGIETPPVDRML